jgi:hypothetical protein
LGTPEVLLELMTGVLIHTHNQRHAGKLQQEIIHQRVMSEQLQEVGVVIRLGRFVFYKVFSI